MKTTLLVIILFALVGSLCAVTRIVDINGSGQFTSIQAGINAASVGDTVKVLPGFYQEAITLNKNIVLQGSGYENTQITSNVNPTITQTGGKLKWFKIGCTNGNGIAITAGTITNCVIQSCAGHGILLNSNNNILVSNCVLLNNSGWGVAQGGNYPNDSVVNCIARNNSSGGFSGGAWNQYSSVQVNYCNGSRNYTIGGQECIDVDPLFISATDFHLAQASPCVNTGHPGIFDPDGTRSDMGYYGGPDAPVHPVVTDMKITPLPGGGVQVEATGRANY